MEIRIERDNGKYVGYKIDGEIINGLYQTVELDKIADNCKNFDIKVENPKNGMVASKMSKRDNLCILTMKFDEGNQVQFLVGNDLNLIELNCIPTEQMPTDLREVIIQAYELTQKNTLKDFIN